MNYYFIALLETVLTSVRECVRGICDRVYGSEYECGGCTGMSHYVSFSFIILTRGSNSREFIADCFNTQYQYQYQYQYQVWHRFLHLQRTVTGLGDRVTVYIPRVHTLLYNVHTLYGEMLRCSGISVAMYRSRGSMKLWVSSSR